MFALEADLAFLEQIESVTPVPGIARIEKDPAVGALAIHELQVEHEVLVFGIRPDNRFLLN